ncbi:alpha/beta fold hydrolase [Candidatus Poribacteria bacterium]|nr:alpha/beta fold hydrolase [Candidatus Poribacteria bacterium]
MNKNNRVEEVRNYRKIEEIIPSHWSEGVVKANGIDHRYYRTGGDKQPLVLLHGFMEGALSWLKTAKILEKDYDIIMIDARGHGKSGGVETGFAQTQFTGDAVGVIKVLELRKPHLMGFSQGGGTGVFIAHEYPELLESLIVVGWGDDWNETEEFNTDFVESESYQNWLESYVSWLEKLKTQDHEGRMISALSQLPPGRSGMSEEEYVVWVENCANLDLSMVKNSASAWAEVRGKIRRMVKALKNISIPTLVMASSFFPTPGEKYIQEEESENPNLRIIRFVNTGHMIIREQFDNFINLAIDFLRKNSTRI